DPDAVRTLLEELTDDVGTDNSASDPWLLTFEGYSAETERLREALCVAGNGYIATRGCAPEAQAGDHHHPGTYAAGVYNRLADEISGQKIDNESLVNLPNWLPLTFRIDGGPWFDIDDADLLSYRQRLDLRHATMFRELRFRDAADRTSTVTQGRFVSMHDPHPAAPKLTLPPQNRSA